MVTHTNRTIWCIATILGPGNKERKKKHIQQFYVDVNEGMFGSKGPKS